VPAPGFSSFPARLEVSAFWKVEALKGCGEIGRFGVVTNPPGQHPIWQMFPCPPVLKQNRRMEKRDVPDTSGQTGWFPATRFRPSRAPATDLPRLKCYRQSSLPGKKFSILRFKWITVDGTVQEYPSPRGGRDTDCSILYCRVPGWGKSAKQPFGHSLVGNGLTSVNGYHGIPKYPQKGLSDTQQGAIWPFCRLSLGGSPYHTALFSDKISSGKEAGRIAAVCKIAIHQRQRGRFLARSTPGKG